MAVARWGLPQPKLLNRMINVVNIIGNTVGKIALACSLVSVVCLFLWNRRKHVAWLDYYSTLLDYFFHVAAIVSCMLLLLYTPIASMIGGGSVSISSILQYMDYCIVMPICMDMCIFGIVMRVLNDYCYRWIALLVGIVLFSFVQGGLMLSLPTVLLAIPICAVFDKTHSLVYVVFLHILSNCILFILNLTGLVDMIAKINAFVVCLFVVFGCAMYLYMLFYVYKKL